MTDQEKIAALEAEIVALKSGMLENGDSFYKSEHKAVELQAERDALAARLKQYEDRYGRID